MDKHLFSSSTVSRGTLMLDAVVVMALCDRFHLNDQITLLSVDVLRIEDTTVGFKAATRLMPASTIESIEIVSPVEFELFKLRVVDIGLNVVKEKIPWHV